MSGWIKVKKVVLFIMFTFIICEDIDVEGLLSCAW